MYDSCRPVRKEITSEFYSFQSNADKIERATVRIVRMMRRQGVVDNKEKINVSQNFSNSENETYIVTIAQPEKQFYLKTFSDNAYFLGEETDGKIHPNELLPYMVFEGKAFAPKTYFLIEHDIDDEGNLDAYKENYIMTEDVTKKGSRFILAADLSEECDIEKLISTKAFAIEISAALLMDSLLSLSDTFGANNKNFGLVFNDRKKTYAIQLIDHMPNANNGPFSIMKIYQEEKNNYSPRTLFSGRKRKTFFSLAAATSCQQVSQDLIRQAVDERVFDEKKGCYDDFATTLNDAEARILQLITDYRANFVTNAAKKLKQYCDKIRDNVAVYEETTYAQLARSTKKKTNNQDDENREQIKNRC
jgi:hypothetical protein